MHPTRVLGIYYRHRSWGCMDQETVAFGGPLAGITVGLLILLAGVPAGGLNPVLTAGGIIALISTGILARNIGALE